MDSSGPWTMDSSGPWTMDSSGPWTVQGLTFECDITSGSDTCVSVASGLSHDPLAAAEQGPGHGRFQEEKVNSADGGGRYVRPVSHRTQIRERIRLRNPLACIRKLRFKSRPVVQMRKLFCVQTGAEAARRESVRAAAASAPETKNGTRAHFFRASPTLGVSLNTCARREVVRLERALGSALGSALGVRCETGLKVTGDDKLQGTWSGERRAASGERRGASGERRAARCVSAALRRGSPRTPCAAPHRVNTLSSCVRLCSCLSYSQPSLGPRPNLPALHALHNVSIGVNTFHTLGVDLGDAQSKQTRADCNEREPERDFTSASQP
uniref:Uncharacterized protein n=1 Tax=Knipowitschia caucasica TaxID=637954 RepID=A0AAV2L4G2_KNICA